MELALFYKIIDELADLNWVGEIEPHSYGEPLLDERLLSLCIYTRQKLPLAKIAIFTNGELLNIDWYKKLVSAGVNKFRVTQHLDNESKGTLDVIRYREKQSPDNIEFTYTRLKYINSRGGLVDVDEGELRQECNYPDHQYIKQCQCFLCYCPSSYTTHHNLKSITSMVSIISYTCC